MNFILNLLNPDGLCCYVTLLLGHHHFSAHFFEATGLPGKRMKLYGISCLSYFCVVKRAPHFEAGPYIFRTFYYSPGPFPDPQGGIDFPKSSSDRWGDHHLQLTTAGATAAKQLHSNSNCHNRNLVSSKRKLLSYIPEFFLSFQDPKQQTKTNA